MGRGKTEDLHQDEQEKYPLDQVEMDQWKSGCDRKVEDVHTKGRGYRYAVASCLPKETLSPLGKRFYEEE